jgi:hypothetical protein
MPEKCQLMRPNCSVIGMDKHTGALFYATEGPMWQPIGASCDAPAATVKQGSARVIKRGAKNQRSRMHIPVPPVVGSVPQLKVMAMAPFTSKVQSFFGPFKVKAKVESEGKSVAVILGGGCSGRGDHLVCGDPADAPSSVCVQMPTSVYAGMGVADVAAIVAGWAADVALSALAKNLSGRVRAKLAPYLRRLLPRLVPLFSGAIDAAVREMTGKGLDQQIESRLRQFLVGKLEEAFLGGKTGDWVAEQTYDQLSEWPALR